MDSAQFAEEFLGGIESLVGLFGQHLMDDAAQRGGNVGAKILQGARLAIDVLDGHGQGGFAVERWGSCEHVVAGNAQGIDVAAWIERSALDLFGAHVERRAERDAHFGEVHGVAFAREAGQAEVGDLHFTRAGEHDVLGFDVAVNDSLFGRFDQGRGGLTHDAQGVGKVGGAVAGEPVAKVLPFDVFLGNEVQAVDVAHLVDLNDTGMDQAGCRPGLAFESHEVDAVVGQFGLENFDGHVTAELNLLGEIDLGHGPASQASEEAEIAQGPAGEVD